MADAALKSFLKLAGYPNAPRLLRRVPLLAKDLQSAGELLKKQPILQGMTVRIISLLDDSEARSGLEDVVTRGGGLVDNSSEKVDAIICDTRGVNRVLDLTKLHSSLNPMVKKINPSGRLVLLGGDSIHSTRDIGAVAVSEAVGGFAKSIALELGAKGITANALQIPTKVSLNSSSPESGTVQFFLSKRSAFITGQVLSVTHSQFHSQGGGDEGQDPTENFAPHSGEAVGSSSEGSHPSGSFSVENKRVVITGAARGIGEYTSRLYAAEGAKVLLVDHPSMESQLKSLATELGGSALSLDVTNEHSPDILYEHLAKTFQPSASSSPSLLDVVVHNAGITRDKTFSNMKEDQFRSVLDVNLASIIRLDEMLLCRSRHVIGNGGRLVYLSSIAGIAGGFGQSNYSTSKAGVMGYVAARAADISPWGIGVNAIAPGFIETEMTKAIPFLVRNIGRRMNALNQGGYPADIAEAALFLSSSASSALNGTTIRVCGKHRVGA